MKLKTVWNFYDSYHGLCEFVANAIGDDQAILNHFENKRTLDIATSEFDVKEFGEVEYPTMLYYIRERYDGDKTRLLTFAVGDTKLMKQEYESKAEVLEIFEDELVYKMEV
jgi:hypothetical protein